MALAIERFGALDILCDNAAVQLRQLDARTHELSESVWDQTFAVNTRSLAVLKSSESRACCGAAVGQIVNVASPTGMVGCAPGYTAYSSSKAAVFGLTRVMAAEYGADNIRVNAVVPGTHGNAR